ncbi:MAG: glycosyltransferase [Ignavibacteriaceae bacterium]
MEIIQFILFLSLALLVALNFFIFLGLHKSKKAADDSSREISFSIIVAAKDEEKNIPALINALKQIDYSHEKFEVIIIDDNSSDNTFSATSKLITGLKNFQIYQVSKKMFPGKKGALNFGIAKATNAFILITDADCKPSQDWLKNFSVKFNEGYDFIFGPAPFENDSNLINKISCYENLRSSVLTFSAANIGFTFSATARNFGFKKSSFEKIYGYQNTTQTLSGDDDLLIREAIKNKMKIGILTEKNSFVYSSAKKTFSDYFKQRTRHTKTSLYYLPSRQIGLGIWHLINLICLFSPLFICVDKIFIIPFFAKILFDSTAALVYQKRFGYNFGVIEIFYLQIIYEFFIIINFFGAIFRRDSWK